MSEPPAECRSALRRRFGRMSLALRRPRGRGIEGEFMILPRPAAHGFHACSDILLLFVRGKVERETGFEPATFCLEARWCSQRKVRKPRSAASDGSTIPRSVLSRLREAGRPSEARRIVAESMAHRRMVCLGKW